MGCGRGICSHEIILSAESGAGMRRTTALMIASRAPFVRKGTPIRGCGLTTNDSVAGSGLRFNTRRRPSKNVWRSAAALGQLVPVDSAARGVDDAPALVEEQPHRVPQRAIEHRALTHRGDISGNAAGTGARATQLGRDRVMRRFGRPIERTQMQWRAVQLGYVPVQIFLRAPQQ